MERPFGRPTHTRVDNIRTDLQEMEYKMWIGTIWLRTGLHGKLLQHGECLGLLVSQGSISF
jgi:hypothetical protein